MKKDYIDVLGIRAHGFHGVFEEEKLNGQEFIVDVRLYLSLRTASQSDNVLDTVNYAELAGLVEAEIQGPSLNLIESLAERIATMCLEHEIVDAVRVKVHKPLAPVTTPFRDIAVCIYRDKI
ncbi:MAG: dihydroneopterin aldolase [Candidatus Nanopelagicales bacterium]